MTQPAIDSGPGRVKPADWEAGVKKKLEAAMPGLYATFVEFRDRQHEQARSKIDYYWKLGRKLLAIKQECNRNKVGKAKVAVKELGKALEINPTDANAAARFASLYPKESHLRALLLGKTPTGKPLIWSHVRLLVTDDLSDEQRAEWVGRCLAEEWSPEELTANLQAALGARPGTGGGRGIAPPKTIGAALAKLDRMNRVWLKFAAEVYGKEDGLAEAIAATPANKLTPDMLDQIDKLAAQLEKMRAMAEPELRTLESLRVHVSGVLNGVSATARVPDDDEPAYDADDEDEDAGEDDEDDDEPDMPVAKVGKPAKPAKSKPGKEKARSIAAKASAAAGKKKRAVAR